LPPARFTLAGTTISGRVGAGATAGADEDEEGGAEEVGDECDEEGDVETVVFAGTAVEADALAEALAEADAESARASRPASLAPPLHADANASIAIETKAREATWTVTRCGRVTPTFLIGIRPESGQSGRVPPPPPPPRPRGDLTAGRSPRESARSGTIVGFPSPREASPAPAPPAPRAAPPPPPGKPANEVVPDEPSEADELAVDDLPVDEGPDLSAFNVPSGTLRDSPVPPMNHPAPTAPGADIAPSDDPWAKPPAFLAAGCVVAGRYRLERRIARGGMGSIWAGVDTTLDRTIAVKFLAAGLTDDAVCRERFDREAKAVAQMRTPYVAMVHDHGVEQGVPYIVMELLDGEDLHRRLARDCRIELRDTARIVQQIARALRQAHAIGIVHRDLKPENIFLARSDDDASGEMVKVLDFGVAKIVGGPQATAAGMVVGSPHYMSPEQMRGEENVDLRADVWALGAITYLMLTGARPYDGTITELALQIGKKPRMRATEHLASLPPAIDAFLEKALAADRNARHATAMDLSEELDEIVSVATLPPPPKPPAPEPEADDPRMRLDTPVVSDSDRPQRLSQRPTLAGMEPVMRGFMPTPAPLEQSPSPWKGNEAQLLPSAIVPAEPVVEKRPKWMPIVLGLGGAFLVLLILALVWNP
jgi:serine/threonine protein kinase